MDIYSLASSSGVCMFHGIKLDKGVDSNVAKRRFKAGRVNRKGDEPSLARVAQFIRRFIRQISGSVPNFKRNCSNQSAHLFRYNKPSHIINHSSHCSKIISRLFIDLSKDLALAVINL